MKTTLPPSITMNDDILQQQSRRVFIPVYCRMKHDFVRTDHIGEVCSNVKLITDIRFDTWPYEYHDILPLDSKIRIQREKHVLTFRPRREKITLRGDTNRHAQLHKLARFF